MDFYTIITIVALVILIILLYNSFDSTIYNFLRLTPIEQHFEILCKLIYTDQSLKKNVNVENWGRFFYFLFLVF